MQIGTGRDGRVHGTGTAVDYANDVCTYNTSQNVGAGGSQGGSLWRMACTNGFREVERFDLYAKARA